MTKTTYSSYRAEQLLDSFYLTPSILNHYGITVEQLKAGLISNQPAFVQLVLMAWAKADRKPTSQVKVLQRRLHKIMHDNAGRRGDRQAPIGHSLLKAAINLFSPDNPDRVTNSLRGFLRSMVEDNALLDKDGKAVSRIAGCFSYDPQDFWEAEVECCTQLRCTGCQATESIYLNPCDWQGLPDNKPYDLVENEGPDNFERVSGPYFACRRCGEIHRVELEEADSLPAANDYGHGEWDFYVDRLQELIDDMLKHIEAAGLPKPTKLAIHAGHIRWDGADGYASCDLSGSELADKLRVNGDFAVHGGKLWLEDGGACSLTCALSHHDGTGAITVEPVWLSELDDDEPLAVADLPRARELAAAATVLFTGSNEAFRFTAGTTFALVGPGEFASELEWMRGALDLNDEDTEKEGAWAAQLAGNMLFDRFIVEVQGGQIAGDRLIITARRMREFVDTLLVEYENYADEEGHE